MIFEILTLFPGMFSSPFQESILGRAIQKDLLDIRIIKMRVRSTASAIWWGVMAGADYITVKVDVLEAGRSLKTFETGTSTALGGFFFGGREVRISRMLDTLSKRIVEKI